MIVFITDSLFSKSAIEPQYSDKTVAALIADEWQVAQLIVHSTCNNIKIERTGVLMSDLDKDELFTKKFSVIYKKTPSFYAES